MFRVTYTTPNGEMFLGVFENRAEIEKAIRWNAKDFIISKVHVTRTILEEKHYSARVFMEGRKTIVEWEGEKPSI